MACADTKIRGFSATYYSWRNVVQISRYSLKKILKPVKISYGWKWKIEHNYIPPFEMNLKISHQDTKTCLVQS